jgi:integrase
MKLEARELKVVSKSNIIDALHFMKEHRFWADSTFQSYITDVKLFETYLLESGLDPILINGEKLHLVHKWIISQKEKGDAYKTISRRVATLSSIFAFYKELGIVKSNPFKASKVPGSQTGEHSRTLDFNELQEVYVAIEDMQKEGIDIDIPVKLLLFTGLRNHAICSLKVENINWEEEMIIYDTGIDNYKHKIQFFPLPPVFIERLKRYIQENKLQGEDNLCYGIKGLPLQNKQLNRITNKVCEYLGWSGDDRVTPHGFRYTIATLLDEKGMSIESIKYLLGHSQKENVYYYLRRDRKKIFQIKSTICEIEKELQSYYLAKETKNNQMGRDMPRPGEHLEKSSDIKQGEIPSGFSEDFLLKLSDKNPELFEKIMISLLK